MKKLLLILFVFIGTVVNAANLYWDYPDEGDVFYSLNSGYAEVDYRVLQPSQYFYDLGKYGVRVKRPGESWGDWVESSGAPIGTWHFIKAGTYMIQAKVHVNYDMGGGSNYDIYSNIITFYVVDNNPPAVPQSVTASWSGDHPVIEWVANTEDDMDSYTIQKRIVGVTGFANVATVGKNTTEWVDNTVEPAGKFDPTYTIEYKVRANDINGNSSSFSPTSSVSGTTDYLWKKPTSLSDAVINEYKLYSNYPNPFNPSTRIEFQIPEEGLVNLTVYNSLGEEVKVLVNGYLGMGRYVAEFNGSNLSSGLYLYRLQVGKFISVGKMLLTK